VEEKRKKILLVDDSDINRMILTEMLSGDFDIVEAIDGEEAVAILNGRHSEFTLMLLDVNMPKLDGFGVLAAMNSRHWIEDLPVIMISAETSPSYMRKAFDLGAVDYISRPYDQGILHRRILNTIMLYAKQNELLEIVVNQIQSRARDNSMMIAILSHIVEFRNGESGKHVQNINILTELIAHTLLSKTDKYNDIVGDVDVIKMASSLHDIGKIGIPEEILNKPGRLTKEEFEIIKTHSALGAETMEKMLVYKDEKLVQYSYQICRWHHERYDGKGYPDGLVGDDIPIAAQIVSLADVYDALTSKRCYKEAYSHEEALRMIFAGECGTFNPILLDCLKELDTTLVKELHNPQRIFEDKREALTKTIKRMLR